jgi:hypothetical protein
MQWNIKMEISHTVRSAMLWDLTQRRMIVSYRSFGTTYPSLIQGSSSPKDCLSLVDGCPETSVRILLFPQPNFQPGYSQIFSFLRLLFSIDPTSSHSTHLETVFATEK